jgi:hypothetical protein
MEDRRLSNEYRIKWSETKESVRYLTGNEGGGSEWCGNHKGQSLRINGYQIHGKELKRDWKKEKHRKKAVQFSAIEKLEGLSSDNFHENIFLNLQRKIAIPRALEITLP